MTRSFDRRGGCLVPPWSTLPQAPLRSRTVGFPPAGAARGFPLVTCPDRAQFQRCPTSTPARSGVLPRALHGSPALPCLWGCPHLHRSYGRMRQSFPLRVPRSSRQHPVCAGGCQPLRGAGPSRCSLCVSGPTCVAPSPGGAWRAWTRFFLHDSGLPLVRTGSARSTARTALVGRRPSRGCRHCFLCRPLGVLATQLTPPATAATVGQP
jgi:hypothetical protein